MIRNNGSVKEMEAAAIAWVAHAFKTPFFALKSITDWVDSHHSTAEQFEQNLEKASQSLCNKAIVLLEYINAHFRPEGYLFRFLQEASIAAHRPTRP